MPRDLKFGERGDDVKQLQTELNRALASRHIHLPTTGYFGSLTKEALIQFQRLAQVHGEHGWEGPLTRAALSARTILVVAKTPPPRNAANGPTPGATGPASTPGSPKPPVQTGKPTVTPATGSPATPSKTPDPWKWFVMSFQAQGGVQNPSPGATVSAVGSGGLQIMPTFRFRPFHTNYFQRHETHIEIGVGAGAQANSLSVATDPRYSVYPVIVQAALVDPWSLGILHTQGFTQVAAAVNGIPSSSSAWDWSMTHYVFQAEAGIQISVDLIPNRWNLFGQFFGGWQYDFSGASSQWIYGGTAGTGVQF